ncbi:hypothetical protein ACFOUP_18575 [Belliella kenyensis]|uniref:Uncharacterized protein n=1 Tax=Belliella kenyensis TaxID=1472724 RepID=A0ABV8ESS5_9BACT|nr:hypothetical protein [Belliella kenyensis]MCH7402217.1 hypothetical protein [Belliella kenyensis]MDN3601731.1 hypothetical protein [Belliella kenyensis]
MSKKHTPNCFDDRNLPNGDISMERSLEIDLLMKDRIEKLKIDLQENIGKIFKKKVSND